MKSVRKLHRRSFLARVAGGGVAVGALALIGGSARAQVTDHDPSDPVGHGRGGGTGITDSDSGPGADPAGRGRGGGPRPGQTGFSDSDSGPGADPAGQGRGTAFGGNGDQYEQRARICRDLQLEIRNLQIRIGNETNYVRQVETTANYISSDYAANNQRRDDYAPRLYGLGISVSYDTDPNFMVGELNRVAAERRRQIEQLERELVNTRNLLAQYNCAEE